MSRINIQNFRSVFAITLVQQSMKVMHTYYSFGFGDDGLFAPLR